MSLHSENTSNKTNKEIKWPLDQVGGKKTAVLLLECLNDGREEGEGYTQLELQNKKNLIQTEWNKTDSQTLKCKQRERENVAKKE